MESYSYVFFGFYRIFKEKYPKLLMASTKRATETILRKENK